MLTLRNCDYRLYRPLTILLLFSLFASTIIPSAASAAPSNVLVTIGAVNGKVGDIVDVPVSIGQPSHGIASYGMELNFDAAALEVLEVAAAYGSASDPACYDAAEGCFTSDYDNGSGWIRAAWIDSTGGSSLLDEAKPLFTIRFHVKNPPVMGDKPISVQTGQAGHFSFTNAGLQKLGAQLIEGKVAVAASADADLKTLKLNFGTLAFQPEKTSYRVVTDRNALRLTVEAANEYASVKINGVSAPIGQPAEDRKLKYGTNTFEIEVTAPDGTTKKLYTLEVFREDAVVSAPSQKIKVDVKAGKAGKGTTVTQTEITRKVETDGKVKDELTLTVDKAKETVEKIKEQGGDTARLVFPDAEDQVSEVNVNVPKDAVASLKDGSVNLEIFTENVRIQVPAQSLVEFNEDLYFRVVPIKTEEEKQTVEQRVTQEQLVRDIVEADRAKVLGRPMTIETNMESRPVTLVMPLPADFPEGEAERARLLGQLMIFIEHDDGTKELVEGKLTEYQDTGSLGIEFGINKFSTFTILQMEREQTALHKPYIRGFEDGTFKPELPVTRAEMAAMLARNLPEGSAASVQQRYGDVADDHWAHEEIAAATEAGLFTGTAASQFSPEDRITRAQMAVIADRWVTSRCEQAIASYSGCSAEQPALAFSDLAGEHWAFDSIVSLQKFGIVNGYADGTFRPDASLTRAEAVVVLNALFQRSVRESAGVQQYSDVTPKHWAFADIEAAH